MQRWFQFFKKSSLKEIKVPSNPINFSWITDTHLPPDKPVMQNLISNLNSSKSHFILHTGDISNSFENTKKFLSLVNEHSEKPFYFVLGNHDYDGHYGEQNFDMKKRIKKTRELIKNFCGKTIWLGSDIYIPLNHKTALIGIDGFPNSEPSQSKLDAENLENKLTETYHSGFRKIIIATHVPPFSDACKVPHAKHLALSKPDYLADYCSEVTGTIIEKFSAKFTDVNIHVYCGHTHAPCYFEHSKVKVKVTVGNAYKATKKILEISDPDNNSLLFSNPY